MPVTLTSNGNNATYLMTIYRLPIAKFQMPVTHSARQHERQIGLPTETEHMVDSNDAISPWIIFRGGRIAVDERLSNATALWKRSLSNATTSEVSMHLACLGFSESEVWVFVTPPLLGVRDGRPDKTSELSPLGIAKVPFRTLRYSKKKR